MRPTRMSSVRSQPRQAGRKAKKEKGEREPLLIPLPARVRGCGVSGCIPILTILHSYDVERCHPKGQRVDGPTWQCMEKVMQHCTAQHVHQCTMQPLESGDDEWLCLAFAEQKARNGAKITEKPSPLPTAKIQQGSTLSIIIITTTTTLSILA